jgi:hypothetical protein
LVKVDAGTPKEIQLDDNFNLLSVLSPEFVKNTYFSLLKIITFEKEAGKLNSPIFPKLTPVMVLLATSLGNVYSIIELLPGLSTYPLKLSQSENGKKS